MQKQAAIRYNDGCPLPNLFSLRLGLDPREDNEYGVMAKSQDEDDQDGGRCVLSYVFDWPFDSVMSM